MKRILTLALLLAIVGMGASAQLLYKITGRDIKQPSYIVGTYHLAPVSFVDSIPGLRKAMDATTQVCGELDVDDMLSPGGMQKMAAAMMLPEGKTLAGCLSADEMKRLNALLTKAMGVDMSNPMVAQQLGRMTPQALTTQLTVMLYMRHTPGFNPQDLFDGYFQKAAKEKGKPVKGLETLDFQIKTLFQGMSLERQKTLLMCLADNTDKAERQTKEVAKAFFAQDIKALEAAMNEKEGNSCDSTPEEDAALITSRNADWMGKMPAMMAAAPTLFAVGAGHLPGSKGVLELLKKAGYTVEAVR